MSGTLSHFQRGAGSVMSGEAGSHAPTTGDEGVSGGQRRAPAWDWVILPLIAVFTIAILGFGTKLFADLEFVHSKPLIGTCIRLAVTGPHAVPNSVCNERNSYNQLVEYRFNSCGDRSPFDCARKPDGVYRVVLIGASNAMGLSVAESDSLAARLSASLSQSTHRRVEVYNAAMLGAGGSPDTLAGRIPQLMALQPDLILWVISSWDISPDKVDFPAQPAQRRTLRWRDLLRLIDQPRVANLLKGYLYRSQSVYLTAYMKRIQEGGQITSASSSEEEARTRMLSLDVATIVDRAKVAGVPVVATFLPNRGESTFLFSMVPRPVGFQPDRLNNNLRTIIPGSGATFVDVLPDLRKAPNLDGLYDPAGAHLNGDGDAVLTQILAKDLTGGAVPALSTNDQAQSEKIQQK